MTQTNNFIQGIVIREENIGEKAKLLHVLTYDQGILKMKAPGAKNLKSSTHSAVQLFTHSEFSVAKGRNGYLTITGATVKNSFFGLNKDISSYSLACYFSSAVSKVVVNDNSSSEILRLFLNCLYALSELRLPSETVKPFFELKLSSICGFSPNLSECSSCGEKSKSLIFDFFSSGLVCEKCQGAIGGMIKSRRFYKLTRTSHLVIGKLLKSDMKKMFSLTKALVNEEDVYNFRNFAEGFICNIFQYEPKTLSFYNQLMRSIRNEELRKKQKNP